MTERPAHLLKHGGTFLGILHCNGLDLSLKHKKVLGLHQNSDLFQRRRIFLHFHRLHDHHKYKELVLQIRPHLLILSVFLLASLFTEPTTVVKEIPQCHACRQASVNKQVSFESTCFEDHRQLRSQRIGVPCSYWEAWCISLVAALSNTHWRQCNWDVGRPTNLTLS